MSNFLARRSHRSALIANPRILLILLLVLLFPMAAFCSEPITGATFGPVSVNKATMGDIWSSTWAADDSIYSIQDDSLFSDGTMASLAVSRLDGNDPQNLSYAVIDKMTEYTKMDEDAID